MSGDLYFSDFCAEAGVEQCEFCGEYTDCSLVQVDELGHRQPVCAACVEDQKEAA